ncbi:MAG: transglutaminase domain-containing protein [Phycisphaeraceae bacterium]|nr:transglutaminase domain-containing protein [Phycisphaeraceae bacterium]
MNHDDISRREAWLRMVLLAAAAGGMPATVSRVFAGQPRTSPKPKESAKPPAATQADFDRVLTRGRDHNWTFKFSVTVRGDQVIPVPGQGTLPIIHHLQFSSAAVVFPIIPHCASCETDEANISSWLTFDGGDAGAKSRIKDGYACGVKLGVWDLQEKNGNSMDLRLEIPMTCWETVLDERAASRLPWWDQPWPESVASALKPDAVVTSTAPEVVDLVNRWTEGKDPKTVPPVVLAKFLMGKVLEHAQPSGKGLRFSDVGGFVGVELQTVATTAGRKLGSLHDINNLYCAVLRAAGLPARTVIGYDVTDTKGEDSGFLSTKKTSATMLRPWVEFCVGWNEDKKKGWWIPADINRLKQSGSRPPALDRTWKGFGTCDEFDDVMPIAFHYHPPTSVVAHGYPAFWGWYTTPQLQVANQIIRLGSQTTPKTASDSRRSR